MAGEAERRGTLQDQVHARLRQYIMSGRFAPGQPLSIRSLAAAMSSGEMPVRDALRRLEAETALVPGPNRALMVPPLDRTALRDIREMRVALEGLAGERAGAHVTAELSERLTELLQAMTEGIAAGDIEAYLAANWQFHRTLYTAADQPLLIEQIEGLWLKIGPHIRLAAVGERHFDHAMAAHRRIADGVRMGDGAAIRRGIEDDIRAAAEDMEAQLAPAADPS